MLKFNTLLIIPLISASFCVNAVDCIPNQIIVKYKNPNDSPLSNSVNTVRNKNGLILTRSSSSQYTYSRVLPNSDDLVLIEGESINSLLKELKNNPKVKYAEPHYIKKLYGVSVGRSDLPNDRNFNLQWDLENQNSLAGYDIDFLEGNALSRKTIPANPIIIAVIDSKFSIDHPDLINQFWVNDGEIPNNGIDDDQNGYIDDVNGFDFVNQSPNVIGEDAHGSHVSGICVAEKDNQYGISGVFPKAKFLPLACGLSGQSLSGLAINQAKDYVADLKIKGHNIVAVNASYGGNIFSQAEYDGIEKLSELGILFCAASGNEAINLELEEDLNLNGILDEGEDQNGNGILDVSYPNNYELPNIISVAATNSNRELAYFSNYGQTQVDIAAPGQSIYSTLTLSLQNEAQKIILDEGEEIGYSYLEFSGAIPDQGKTGDLIYCGLGYSYDFPPSVNGNIALIQRGILTFNEKVSNAMEAGAIAAVIYNNVSESIDTIDNWTLINPETPPWVPVISITQVDGLRLNSLPPLKITLLPNIQTIDEANSYGYSSGTSMATPMVSGAAAFAAYNFPEETMLERRSRILNNVVIVNSLESKVLTSGILNLRKIIDTDEDGLPDWWELDYFENLSYNNRNDIDNDGYNNLEEFLTDTNPIKANSHPNFKEKIKLEAVRFKDINKLEFNFISYPDYTYLIESSPSLNESWKTEAINTGNGVRMKATINGLESFDKRYFRIKAIPYGLSNL